jgi:hypothetical protein
MRTIEDFKVTPADQALEVSTRDEPGHGGAHHHYRIGVAGHDGFNTEIHFQNGPVKSHGTNGVTEGALLAIVIDRLRSFQAGKFACRENALALTKLEEAQHWLAHRTRARVARGVEGENKV